MVIDLTKPNQKNFQTAEKDLEKIVGKLMSRQDLLKLLYYNDSKAFLKDDITDNSTKLKIGQDNIRLSPKITIPENKGSYVIVTFDNFSPNDSNPQFVDNAIIFDVLCPTDIWQMDSYMLRPFRIMNILQELFDKQKLNGIGTTLFVSANLLNLGEYSGYQVIYQVINSV